MPSDHYGKAVGRFAALLQSTVKVEGLFAPYLDECLDFYEIRRIPEKKSEM